MVGYCVINLIWFGEVVAVADHTFLHIYLYLFLFACLKFNK